LVEQIENYNKGLNATDKLTKSIKNENVDVNALAREISIIQSKRLDNLKSEEEANAEIKDLVAERLFGTTDTVNLSEEQLSILNDVTNTLKEQASIYVSIEDVNKQLAKLTKEINDNIESQTKKLEDTEGIENFIKQNRERIGEIKEFFSTLSSENSNLTEEQIENLNRQINNIEIENALDKVNEVAQAIIAVFSDISGRISSIVSQQNSLALEQLQYQEEQTLASIGNATEDASAEQERARKEFAKKRFDLEKSSRVTELQFSIADAIAQGASATLQALASIPFPASLGVGAIYAGITAAQIATINSQLQFTKSKQFVGRRGGLLVGNSHENGGIMANGGLVLEGGEAVINRNAVSQFSDILSQMSMSTGGRPLVGDDSRIVEEIRRQNQRPIKTYVLDRDIQNTRKINDRLSQLARL
jgi:chromosome segregation ATPase